MPGHLEHHNFLFKRPCRDGEGAVCCRVAVVVVVFNYIHVWWIITDSDVQVDGLQRQTVNLRAIPGCTPHKSIVQGRCFAYTDTFGVPLPDQALFALNSETVILVVFSQTQRIRPESGEEAKWLWFWLWLSSGLIKKKYNEVYKKKTKKFKWNPTQSTLRGLIQTAPLLKPICPNYNKQISPNLFNITWDFLINL